jgi:hypothetical protein
MHIITKYDACQKGKKYFSSSFGSFVSLTDDKEYIRIQMKLIEYC